MRKQLQQLRSSGWSSDVLRSHKEAPRVSANFFFLLSLKTNESSVHLCHDKRWHCALLRATALFLMHQLLFISQKQIFSHCECLGLQCLSWTS